MIMHEYANKSLQPLCSSIKNVTPMIVTNLNNSEGLAISNNNCYTAIKQQ